MNNFLEMTNEELLETNGGGYSCNPQPQVCEPKTTINISKCPRPATRPDCIPCWSI